VKFLVVVILTPCKFLCRAVAAYPHLRFCGTVVPRRDSCKRSFDIHLQALALISSFAFATQATPDLKSLLRFDPEIFRPAVKLFARYYFARSFRTPKALVVLAAVVNSFAPADQMFSPGIWW